MKNSKYLQNGYKFHSLSIYQIQVTLTGWSNNYSKLIVNINITKFAFPYGRTKCKVVYHIKSNWYKEKNSYLVGEGTLKGPSVWRGRKWGAAEVGWVAQAQSSGLPTDIYSYIHYRRPSVWRGRKWGAAEVDRVAQAYQQIYICISFYTEAIFLDVNMGGMIPDGTINGSESCQFIFW